MSKKAPSPVNSALKSEDKTKKEDPNTESQNIQNGQRGLENNVSSAGPDVLPTSAANAADSDRNNTQNAQRGSTLGYGQVHDEAANGACADKPSDFRDVKDIQEA